MPALRPADLSLAPVAKVGAATGPAWKALVGYAQDFSAALVPPPPPPPSPSPEPQLLCRPLAPLADAVVFWPGTLPDGASHAGIDDELPATARGPAVGAFWEVSLCTGRPYGGASALPPGTLSRCPGGACAGARNSPPSMTT